MSSKKVKRFGSGPIEIQKNQKKMFGRSVTAGDLTYLGVNDPTASKEAVVIKRSELEGLQDTLKLSNTARERALVVSEREQEKLRIAELAKQRKERLLEIDAQKKAGDGGLSAEELEQRKSEMLFARGMRQIRDEEHDDVKHMNQLMLYAKIMTTRDQQILEKERIRQKEIEEEKVLDAETDAADKKWLAAQKERERTLRDRQKAAKNVIVSQIQERENQRMREREQKEAEAQLMLQRIAEIEQREDEERKAKQQAGKQLLEQVVKDNTAQARAKLRRKQEDIDEDARIQEFIRQREAREAELEAEQARIKAEKDKEIAKLRAQQEKAQDRQSAIDELRAKRYQEAKDREWRKKQMEIAQKRDALKQEIALAREQQRAEKARQMAEQALHERDEYYRVIEQQKSQHDQDVAKRQTEAAKQEAYRAQLQAQINERDLEKKTAKQRFLKENLIVDQTAAEKARLEAIRQRKLDELAAAGVPEKYRIDLARKKILHASIH